MTAARPSRRDWMWAAVVLVVAVAGMAWLERPQPTAPLRAVSLTTGEPPSTSEPAPAKQWRTNPDRVVCRTRDALRLVRRAAATGNQEAFARVVLGLPCTLLVSGDKAWILEHGDDDLVLALDGRAGVWYGPTDAVR